MCDWCKVGEQWRHKACTNEIGPKTYQCLTCKSKLVVDEYGSDDSDASGDGFDGENCDGEV